MIKRFFGVVLSGFLMCSCMQTGFVKLGSEATVNNRICSVENIQVFSSEADVTGTYDKIGIVTYRGWQADIEVILSWLKGEASKKGGNAIVLRSVNPKGLFTWSYGTGEALVIRIKSK
jgi:hypothetical protein